MKSFALLALASISLTLVSCNTFIGMGRDLRLAGEGMEKAANKTSSGGGDADADTGGAPIY